MKVYCLKLDGTGPSLVCRSIEEMNYTFMEATDSDMFTVEIEEMTQEQLDNLPEFNGF